MNNILIYTTPDGKKKLEVNLKDETLWLSLDQIAELFQRNKSTRSRHIKNIFQDYKKSKEYKHENTSLYKLRIISNDSKE